jgi:2-polyprenyl-3-methyl-5-hydroxy-6-metoxy-1,4-benzoquinol methylase
LKRAEKEKKAYDEDNVWEHSNRWHMKFRHVLQSPNTIRGERLFQELIKRNVAGKKILDIGCGGGESSRQLLSSGAKFVYGIDISEKFIIKAKEKGEIAQLEFANKDIMEPIEGKFDVIFGRAILHHIDYQAVIKRLYISNLNPGGIMLFMEPLGNNLLLRLFRLVAKSAHTPDERPFFREDIKWLKENYGTFDVLPINYSSLPFGIISTWIFSDANNLLLRLCDKFDCWFARNMKYSIPNFRQAIFVIKKRENESY